MNVLDLTEFFGKELNNTKVLFNLMNKFCFFTIIMMCFCHLLIYCHINSTDQQWNMMNIQGLTRKVLNREASWEFMIRCDN